MNHNFDKFIISKRNVVPPRGVQKTNIGIAYIADINHYRTVNAGKKVHDSVANLSGAGTGDTPEQAMFLATMEAYERLANSIPTKRTIVATEGNLKNLAVPLTDFPQISERETNSHLKPSNSNQKLRWCESLNITEDKICYIPQIYINLFTQFDYEGENISHSISTGCAIHQNYIDAVINGIYEVIERDGIALTWLLKRPLKEVSEESYLEDLNIFTHPFLGKTTLYEASTVDGIHTFCLRAETNHSQELKNVLMFSTNACPKKAIHKIKKELISVMFSLVSRIPKQKELLSRPYDLFYSVDEGALFMAHETMANKFSFLEGNGIVPFPTEKPIFNSNLEELHYLIDCLKEQGHKVYVTDLTSRECREQGLCAVKVTIPSLQPISFVHSARYLKSQRLESFATQMFGYYDEELINEEPLPFS
ncbi:YcaO-like family protein [Lysinibacillus capsici]|uniref:YcaO-like family protein n=1 Tax=Lysinibacillus capsici TaxID=2115968 RepID=UPI0001DA5B49|nr:YcaO-like family protein [Lysinibacillus capsici]EFI66952.1 putative cytoplasmic protein [Lysinibacillus fusiformis ZC1]EKU44184.1 putative cytoplasmic protein [Lysinibacillus fusiformis ZB2]MED4701180.1 YcaO-like family protein [Lysinibacillus capsici]